MSKILTLFLIFLSFINILMCKIKKIRLANYFILDFKNANIDKRSLLFFEVKDLKKTLNLIRINNIDLRLFLKVIKVPNFFCYTLINNFFHKYVNKNFFFQTLIKIFNFLEIKKLLLIDDKREMKLLSKLIQKNKLDSLIYMHGRFSHKDKIISNTIFSKYLVWSEFFKKQLLISNKEYNKKNVIVVGNPNLQSKNFKIKKMRFKIKNCLILDEDFIEMKDIKKYFNNISKLKNINFFFKKKITREIPAELKKFFLNKRFQILENSENFNIVLKKYKIDSVLASTSTGLLEASYYHLIPIKIYSKNKVREKEFSVFSKNKMVFSARTSSDLLRLLQKNYNFKDINLIKRKLWGNLKFDSKKIKKIKNSFLHNYN